MAADHQFRVQLEWTGNEGTGTSDYRSYSRDHVLRAPGKADLLGSSDPVFRGDATRWNPEELLVASLAQCHMLWYLHLCARDGIRVATYADEPEGMLALAPDGSGRFTEVLLRPRVTIRAGEPGRAIALHEEAHRMCFIAASVRFPVRHHPTVERAPVGGA